MTKRRKGGDVNDVAQKAYDATASFGVFIALIQAIGGTLLALLLIGAGIYMITLRDAYKGKTLANVTASRCSSSNGENKCVIDYEYTVNGTTYKKTGYELQGTYVSGSTIKMLYDTNNPNNHKVNPTNWSFIGWICVVIGIVIIIIAWVWFYIARTYKIAAAATGVGAVTDIALDTE